MQFLEIVILYIPKIAKIIGCFFAVVKNVFLLLHTRSITIYCTIYTVVQLFEITWFLYPLLNSVTQYVALLALCGVVIPNHMLLQRLVDICLLSEELGTSSAQNSNTSNVFLQSVKARNQDKCVCVKPNQ